MSIDRKFRISATSIGSTKTHDENDSVLFLAKDKAFLMTLPQYRLSCVALGAGPEQIRAVDLLIARVQKYQNDNPDKAMVPDVDPIKESQCLER